MSRIKNKRSAILGAAASVFNQKGFYQANISEIAEEAGIGKGTVYEYFNSKDELFIQVIEFNIDRYVKRIEHAVQSADGFYNKLDAFIDMHQAIIGENFEATGNMLSTQNPMNGHGPEVLKILIVARMRVCGMLSEILSAGKEQGIIDADDIDFVADVAYDMIGRISIRVHLNKYSLEQIKEERKKFINMLFKGIGK